MNWVVGHFSERDHPLKTSANFHDFWPLPPSHRQPLASQLIALQKNGNGNGEPSPLSFLDFILSADFFNNFQACNLLGDENWHLYGLI